MTNIFFSNSVFKTLIEKKRFCIIQRILNKRMQVSHYKRHVNVNTCTYFLCYFYHILVFVHNMKRVWKLSTLTEDTLKIKILCTLFKLKGITFNCKKNKSQSKKKISRITFLPHLVCFKFILYKYHRNALSSPWNRPRRLEGEWRYSHTLS
jgi:hypothetical protein